MRAGLPRVVAVGAAVLALSEGEDPAGFVEEPLEEDLWAKLTQEEWQPGYVNESGTTFPMKDLGCTGPQTRMVSNPALSWQAVKEQMHQHLGDPTQDPWLFQTAMTIQKEEPDACVLGVTSTSAYLLPVVMPKFRNMARVLSSDANLLVLNVTFYDTLRSGFPIFGILDGLATPQYRAWFGTPESFEYFPEQSAWPSCDDPSATALLHEIGRGRGSPTGWRAPLALAVAAYTSRQAAAPEPCLPALSAALLVFALARVQSAPSGAGASREAILRDVVELVSRAEEHLRNHTYQGVPFGLLVASPWSPWWLLHRLQLELPRLFAPHGRAVGAGGPSPGRDEL